MKIGYVQTSPTFSEKNQNFEQVKNLLSNTKADLIVLPELFATGYTFISKKEAESKVTKQPQRECKPEDEVKVTFIELGSVNCIPCKKMQPVMKAVEEKYGDQLDVIFYDVWQEDQKHYAKDYGIRLGVCKTVLCIIFCSFSRWCYLSLQRKIRNG